MIKKSTILTVMGAIGVVATTVTAIKATPKAVALLEEAKEAKQSNLSKLDIFKIVGPVYIPTTLLGLSTILCIFGANALNKRQQAIMASSYAMLNESYNRYRENIKALYGEKVDEIVYDNANMKIEESDKKIDILDSNEVKLFFDYDYLRYFEAPINEVIQKTTLDDGLECIVISIPPSDDRPDFDLMNLLYKES